jgi:hypothetical protein
VTVGGGGEITLPDGTTVTVEPGATIDPITGVVTKVLAENKTPVNSGATEAENASGGCNTAGAGFIALCGPLMAASLFGKSRRTREKSMRF